MNEEIKSTTMQLRFDAQSSMIPPEYFYELLDCLEALFYACGGKDLTFEWHDWSHVEARLEGTDAVLKQYSEHLETINQRKAAIINEVQQSDCPA